MFDDKPKKSRAGMIETSESEAEVQPKKSSKKNEPQEVLDLETDSEKENKDEFDVSDSDDGGLAKKVVTQAKKPPPKKLTKSSDLFSDMMAAGGGAVKSKAGPASKKLPVPKKPLGQSQKHKKSESESDNKPVKKKPKKVGHWLLSNKYTDNIRPPYGADEPKAEFHLEKDFKGTQKNGLKET